MKREKGQSLLEAIIVLGVLSFVSAFVFSLLLRISREISAASLEMKFSEALKRSKIYLQGEFDGVKWKKRGKTLTVRAKKRKIFLKIEEESDEELRLYPR